MHDKAPMKMRIRRLSFYVLLSVFLFAAGAAFYVSGIAGRSSGDILRLHGWVEGTDVSLSAKVKGEVIRLAVIEGSDVKKGDLVAQIKSDQVQSQIMTAKAKIEEAEAMLVKTHNRVEILKSNLEGAKIALDLSKNQSEAKIRQAEASVASAKAVLSQAETNFAKAAKDYARYSALVRDNIVPQSKMDGVDETYKVAQAEVERAARGVSLQEAGLTLAKTSLTETRLRENDIITIERELVAATTEEAIASAGVDAVRAQKSEIEATLADTFIYSPIDGTVTNKMIEVGENVVPGAALVVVTDLSDLYVKTYVEQMHIGKIKLNTTCRIHVDSFPDRAFNGKVIFMASRAEFTPRDVQMDEHRTAMVYKIKVGIDNPEGRLKPGIPADVDLKWD
ncbi:MAG: HlyD family secretion protein [Syntrophobacteraceae bacterium]